MEPVMLHNPLGDRFEVMSGGTVYIFEPGQSRIVLGETARQILRNQNTPLIAVQAVAQLPVMPEAVTVAPVVSGAVDYDSMTYTELRSIASAKKLFKVGMKRAEVLSLLNG